MTTVAPDAHSLRSTPESPENSRVYRLLLWSIRAAWGSCTIGVVAMLPGLVLRSSELVTVFKIGLSTTFGVSVVAVLLFLAVTARMSGSGTPEPRSLGSRADALVAILLADLLGTD